MLQATGGGGPERPGVRTGGSELNDWKVKERVKGNQAGLLVTKLSEVLIAFIYFLVEGIKLTTLHLPGRHLRP